jgi:hypothetical protein
MPALPLCAFEQHLGACRAIDDFERNIVDEPRLVLRGSEELLDAVRKLLGFEDGQHAFKVGWLSTLDRKVLRSIQDQAVLVAVAPHVENDRSGCDLAFGNGLLATFLSGRGINTAHADCIETGTDVQLIMAGRRLGAQVRSTFANLRETVEVLNHYPTTDLLPQLNRHVVFAMPGDLERHNIALDPATALAFERGEVVVPVLPSHFLWDIQNSKGRIAKSELADQLFGLACAFSVLLNQEAAALCRITGDRRASAALKRECVQETITAAGFRYAEVDGRGADRDSWVETTVLRRGSPVLASLPMDLVARWAFDETAPETPDDLPPRDRYVHALNAGRLKRLAATIGMLFQYATRATAIEVFGYRELRRGRTDGEDLPEIADTDAFGTLAEADLLLLDAMERDEPDPWTRIALDFGLNLAPLYPAFGYLLPTVQAALAVRRLLEGGKLEIADRDDRIEILPLFHHFQTESLDGGLPPALRASRKLLRGLVRRLGLEAQATRDPRDRQVLLPISETDRARIRIALATRVVGKGA